MVQKDASDSGHLGSLTSDQTLGLSAFLARHEHTRYELASATAAKAAPLIERDARPVLMLGTQLGHAAHLRSGRFRKDVRNDEVRYVLLSGRCGPRTALTPTGCGRAARWAEVHGTDVSELAHLPPHTLVALIPASARAGTHNSRHARRLPLDPHRRRRVDAARNPHPLVPARRTRDARRR